MIIRISFILYLGETFLSFLLIKDFDVTEGNKIGISDLLDSYAPLSNVISDFIQITDNDIDTLISNGVLKIE